MLKKMFAVILMIIFLFGIYGCQYGQEGIEITDMAGTKVVVKKNIKKVAAVSPSTADLMIAFGLGEKIDGVYKTVVDNEWSTFFYPNVDKFYKYDYDESAESYFSRGVDLILLPDPTMVDQLRKSGLPVLNIRQYAEDSFDDYLFSFSEILRQIFPEVSEKIDEWQHRMNKALEDVTGPLETQSTKPSLYYIYGDKLNSRGSHLAYTDMPNSFVASILRKLNVKFVSDNFTSNRPSEEEVLKTNPDIILIGGIYQKSLYDELMANTTWNKLDVVTNQRVYNIPVGFTPFEQNSIESPIFIYDLANKVYPEFFNFDINEITKETFKYWFGIALTEEQIEYLLNGFGPTGKPLIIVD